MNSEPESKTKKLKILIGGYHCAPYRGSEPGVGWNFSFGIAQHHEVHVIVEEGYKKAIIPFTKEFPEKVKNMTFHYIPNNYPSLLCKLCRPAYYHYYRQWQKKAYNYARELDKTENFDLVHQITMAGYREPGYLFKLGKPYIIGPLGGFVQSNWRLLLEMGGRNLAFYGARNILNSLQKRFGIAAKYLPRYADTIIVSDSTDAADVKKYWKRESQQMREVGTFPTGKEVILSRRSPEEPLRICWVGLLVPGKALEILLHAILQCKNPIEVTVLGGGVMEKKWKKLANDWGVEKQVHFKNQVHHDDVLKYMANSHALCITSIHEGGTGTVVLEALQNGLPLISMDHCAFRTVINERIGIKIPIKNKQQIYSDYAKAMDFMYENEDIRYQMAQECVKESQLYAWDNKIKQLLDIYEQVLKEKSAKKSQ